MKKETKYTLLSLPGTFLLMIAINLVFSMFEGGKCVLGWGTPKICGFGEWVHTLFLNTFFLSVFLSPLYIIIPLLTFFITRYFKIKHQTVLTAQPSVTLKQSKRSMWVVIFVIVLFYLFIWPGSIGHWVLYFFLTR